LALCAAQIGKAMAPRDDAARAKDVGIDDAVAEHQGWLLAFQYEVDPAFPDHDSQSYRREHAEYVAARLVAWVRWKGACSECGYADPACDCWHGRRFAPELHHKLNALASWDERVRLSRCERCASARRITMSNVDLSGSRLATNAARRQQEHFARCDGINWDYLAVICDVLTESRLACWDDVHRWREPVRRLITARARPARLR
jgi:hypothetical protein